MKPRIYIETSVISYLTSRPSRDVVSLARQQRTHELWLQFGIKCTPVISSLVIEEVSKGDATAARQRLEVCRPLESLEVSASAYELARTLIARGAIPATEPEDALHIAIASLAGVDYIASWTFAHIVGAQAKLKLQLRMHEIGLPPIPIATPDEILEELGDE
jgi:predicted nucleic acid-binding protein